MPNQDIISLLQIIPCMCTLVQSGSGSGKMLQCVCTFFIVDSYQTGLLLWLLCVCARGTSSEGLVYYVAAKSEWLGNSPALP